MKLGYTVGAALKWMIAARFAGQLITWVVTIIVIRILTPEDYGLMALAMAMISFLSLFEEIGLGSAIVQRAELEPRLLELIFGLLIVLDLLLYAFIWVGAPFVAGFFDVPELTDILRTVGLLLIVNAFGTLPDAILSRRMEFRGKSIALFASMMTGSFLTLALALQGRGVWSLVIGTLFMAAVRVVTLQYFARVWYWPRFALSGLGSAARFGGFITIDRLLWYVYAQSDALIIGKLLGKEMLGFYSVGMHLASLPMQKLAGMLNEIGFSAFTRLQGDRAALRHNFIKSVRLLSLLSFPVFLGISSVAPEIVGVFLGSKWQDTVLPIQLLSLVVPLRLLSTILSSSLYGIRHAEVSVSINLIGCVVMPLSFAVGAQYGLKGVCVAWVLAYPVYFMLSLLRGLPMIGVKVAEYLRAMRGPALSAVIMYSAVFGLRRLLGVLDLPAPVILSSLVLLGVLLYAFVAVILQWRTCVDLVSLVWSEDAGARVAAFDPGAPLKAMLPRSIQEELPAPDRAPRGGT